MQQTRLETAWGEIRLQRYPRQHHESLRAWDAADEYLLRWLAQSEAALQNLLIVNDGFGALSVALQVFHPQHWSDSWLAQQACRDNLRDNGVNQNRVRFVQSLDTPQTPLDTVLIKAPKTLALLEYQLLQLKPLLHEGSRVLVAGMTRAMPGAVWKLLESLIGPTHTQPAIKKAKLIEVQVDTALALPTNPYPVCWPLEHSELILCNHANVFSRDRLDIGARFMLEHLPRSEGPVDIIDMGCGNGVLGLMAALQNPQAKIHFIDESCMAIASARLNCTQLTDRAGHCHFHLGDGLLALEDQSADLILCNPPFHQQQAIGDEIALGMFRHAARVLRAEGELWVIGNRHLGYHNKLKSHFGRVEMVVSNQKFIILKAIQ